MISKLGAAATGVAAIVAAAASIVAYTSSGAAQTTVTADDFYFCDPSLQGAVCETQIEAGGTVIWSVAGGFHTVTRCDETYTTCPTSGGFDSGQLTAGDTFQQTFDSTGTFYYRCNVHPDLMRGTITVTEAQDTPTPAPTDSPAPTAVASPTPVSTPSTPTPASAPSTGGAPTSSDRTTAWLLLVIAGGLAAAAGATVVLRTALSSRRP